MTLSGSRYLVASIAVHRFSFWDRRASCLECTAMGRRCARASLAALVVCALAAPAQRARASGFLLYEQSATALAKGATMGAFGLWVLGITGWHAWHGTLPQAVTMGAVGSAALFANAASFGLLWKYREGDANMRSA